MNHTIRKIVLASSTVSTVAGLAGTPSTIDGTLADARFTFPGGIVADTSGDDIFVSSAATIRRISLSSNQVTTIAGMAGTSGYVDGIGSAARLGGGQLALDTNGDLLMAEGARIRRISSNGLVTTLAGTAHDLGVRAGPLPASLNRCMGIAVSAGGIAVTDFAENVVLLIR